MHHWSKHGIAGRGILLDYWSYAQKQGIMYDPYSQYQISYDELYRCGQAQGIDIRPEAQGGDVKIGDLLFIRGGWNVAYNEHTPEERTRLALRDHSLENPKQFFAGVAQEEKTLDWLHDCYFAAVGGDAPTFEAWPTNQSYFLHEYILALWGMPLGEMLDLEDLAAKCRELNRWTFFFTSSPANVPRGVSTHVNGIAFF